MDSAKVPQPEDDRSAVPNKPPLGLNPGDRLSDRYRIEGFLETRRGYAIYKGWDELSDHPVIIKARPIHSSYRRSNALQTERFPPNLSPANPWLDEFAILSSVSYPTAVKAVDLFEAGDEAFIILEYLEGQDLEFKLAHEHISVQQSCEWIVQLCQLLSQFHRRQIVHLDLQPRYLIVSTDNQRIRLIGFDIARQFPLSSPVLDYTPLYSGPEFLDQRPDLVDERSDIYSLGIIWYQMLTGIDLSQFKMTGGVLRLPSLRETRPSLHPGLVRIVHAMIDHDPENRFSTVDDVKRSILHLYKNLSYRVGFYSDKGMIRENNEDSFYTQERNYCNQDHQLSTGVFIIADGMGGQAGGEFASSLAIRESVSLLNTLLKETQANQRFAFTELWERAVKQANLVIHNTAKQISDYDGMGTTFTGALVYAGQATIGHVGDSRAYLVNNSGITQVSDDHSLVARLIKSGSITHEESLTHPLRNMIYNSLGAYPDVKVDTYQINLRPRDRLLLCSDGLNEHVRDEEIHQIIMQCNSPDRACTELVNLANARGGFDNVTVILLQMDEIA